MLTDLKVRQAKPGESDYKLADAGGLYLLVTKGGAKSWRLKYRFAGTEKRLTFGQYPEVSLGEARKRRDEARRLLRELRDPALEAMKQRLGAAAAAAATFEKVAREWHELQSPRWVPVHSSDVIRSLEREVFPQLGSVPLREIDVPLTLAVLRKIERRGALETSKRVRQRMSAVFVHGISIGASSSDPASPVTKALKPAPKKTRQPAMTGIDALRDLLRAAEGSGASPVTKLAS
ncbi:MAG TPA: integrase arm-type DNA-binding domain-containing protein, partial [Polyangiaceae bacterium]|nr:integrase arm-type DNA-binding domain-containing protein [Polyangiaceae bacterium]